MTTSQAERQRHRLIVRVTENIQELHFHVAIAALMEELNWLREHAQHIAAAQWQQTAMTFVVLLAPLAPHLAEELWEHLGHAYSVHHQAWPTVDPALLTNDTIELPVQVNGKVRDRNTVSGDADDERIKQVALASTRVQALLNGTHPTRVVVVPGQIVNIVVQP